MSVVRPVSTAATSVDVPTQAAGSRRTAVTRVLTDRVRDDLRSGRSVLVVGDAGVGKTHLVTAALAPLRIGTDASPAATVITVSGAAALAGVPLGALEPLLGEGAAEALGSVPRTVEALSAFLASRARDGAVILRVEDAHLLDTASSQALAWMVQQDEVHMVATARTSAVSVSPWLELWKDGLVERADVPPFTLAETEQWLVGELGGDAAQETVRRVFAETGGNPFYLGEVVRAEREGGAWSRHGGLWVWTGSATPGRRLLDVVANDMSRLSPDARLALEAAALACPMSLTSLLELVPRPAVDELSRLGLLSLSPRLAEAGEGGVTVDLAHALYAEAVRSGVPRARRREVLERVAAMTHDGRRGGADLVRSVTLALDSDVQVAPERLDAAVQTAFELEQPQTAARLLSAALRQLPVGDARRAPLLLQRADAWWHADDAALAQRDLAEVFDALWSTPEPDVATVRLMIAATAMQASLGHFRRGDIADAMVPFEAAERWIAASAGPHAERGLAELNTARLTQLGLAGEHRLDEAVAVLLDPSIGGAAVPLAAPTILGLAQAGRSAEALSVARRSMHLAAAHHDQYRWGAGEVAVAEMLATLWSGDIEATERLVDSVTSTGLVDSQLPLAMSWLATHMTSGLLGMARGTWSQAYEDIRVVSARLAQTDLGYVISFAVAAEALTAAASGDASTARALLDKDVPFHHALEPEVRLLRSDALAWLRDPRAIQEARDLAHWARSRGLARTELEALHRSADRRRPGTRPRGVDPVALERVRELAGIVDGRRSAALVRHVEAQATGDDDLIRMAERELNGCGLWLPPVEPHAALTRREQEIAALAAGGLSSRAIAARLTLSVRTVDSHLARVFSKTGVRSREELSAVLR